MIENAPHNNPCPPPHERLQLTVPPALEGLSACQEQVESFLRARGLSAESVYAIGLAFEELVVNVLEHGGEGSGSRRIEVEVRQQPGVVELQVLDSGPAFDPLSVPPPDLSLPIEDRPVGGLGIHILRRLSDRMEYERRDGANIVTLCFNSARRR